MKQIVILMLSAVSYQLSVLGQGALTPPGSPAPTMRSLDQIEPRTPISNLPATITASGSYYLTTNVTGLAGGTNGILVSASDVTLDLMGFALSGVAGSGRGIWSAGLARTNLVIRNGIIRFWGDAGIDLSTSVRCRFENLRVVGNTGTGIWGGLYSEVRDCSVSTNGLGGISLSDSVYVTGTTAANNLLVGFKVGGDSLLLACFAGGNAGGGILAAQRCHIKSCVAVGNGADGMHVGDESIVSECVAGTNAGDGIEGPHNCLIVGNDLSSNGAGAGTGAGVHTTGTNNRIDGNQTIGNDMGIKTDLGANWIVRNSAANNPPSGSVGTSNYVFTAGDIFGPTNSITGEITDTNPWRNFRR